MCTLSANQAGDANYSAAPQVTASVVIAQAGQRIVFDELPDRTLGDPPFVLTASSSTGLAVAFASATTLVCTVTGSTVTLVAPGTCSIEANQAGNANISAALPVTQSFTVEPVSQSISFAALPDRNLGDPPVALSATASSGLAVSFTSATAAVCSITDVTLTLIAPGTCTIAADQAGDSRYGAAPQVTQSFTVKPAGVQVYFIHSDHLNTPRLVTDAANNSVWRWDNVDPFGGNMPDENPGGLGTFTNNLRFPGQYFDRETNLHYNYFRDYDPGMGRYIESDPIGLAGGLNTYPYVRGNPLSYSDPYGLFEMYGNWGGRNWSGGQAGPRIPANPAPPTDSMDACFMIHDYCYQKNEDNQACRGPGYPFSGVRNACNQALVQCLQRLPTNTADWPSPPINLVNGKNQHSPVADEFRSRATWWFQ